MAPGLRGQRLTDSEVRRGLHGLLAAPRYEVLPLEGVVDDVVVHVPEGATVTVTASPARGPEATLAVAEALSRQGFQAVPHLAARQHTPEMVPPVVDRLRAAGVRELFVIGGDDGGAAGSANGSPGRGSGKSAQPQVAGFRDGEGLLSALRQAAPEMSVGVPGYPEGHPSIPNDVLDASLRRKLQQADRVVGQLCFDARPVHQWAERVRTLGPAQAAPAPVYAGVAGAVSSARLLRIASRIGVGDSLRFLKGRAGVVRKLATTVRHDPTELVTDLIGADGESFLAGLHLYTFNAVEQTEQWRLRLLARLREGEPL